MANGIFASSSVFDPSILNWITYFFVLTIVTQIAATTLIAGRIYAASQPFRISGEIETGEIMGTAGDDSDIVGEKRRGGGGGGGGGRKYYEPTQREKYLATVWLVVESGLIYSSAAIVQLVTSLLKMNTGVIMEFMLSQLSVRRPFFWQVFFILLIISYSFFFPDRQWFR